MKKIYLIIILSVFSSYLTSFAQTYEKDLSLYTGSGFNGEVNSIEIDGNDKMVIGGDFTSYNETTVSYLIRLNSDGTADNGYGAPLDGGLSGPQLSNAVTDLTIHSDNSVTVVTAGGLTRFTPTGSLITPAGGLETWSPNAVVTVAAESSGTDVIVGGYFTDVSNRIVKLNSSNLPDETFVTNIGSGFNDRVRTIEITDAGKILVGGDFTSFNGTTRNHIALLNSDGTLDTTFDPGSALASDLTGTYAVAMQSDGKILAGSNPSGSTRVVRFNTDGSIDSEFNGTISGLSSLVTEIHTDNTDDIIVGGWFSQGLSMLDYTTGVATDIAAGHGIEGATAEVNALKVDADGSIVFGGDFTSYNGIYSINIARGINCHVNIDTQPTNVSTCEGESATFSVSAIGGSQYQWQINTNNGFGQYYAVNDVEDLYSGALTPTLTISNVTSDLNNYVYRCLVIDSDNELPTDCSSSSLPVVLTVSPVQVFATDPDNVTTCEGQNTSFSVSVSGSFGGYQWQVDPGTGTFEDIAEEGIYSNVNNSILSLTGVTLDMSGYKYRLKSTKCDPSGLFSLPATLTVSELPVITQSSDDVGICINGDASYSVVATSSSDITYQWQYTTTGHLTAFYYDLTDNSTYSGVTTPTLTITDADNTLPELYDNEGDVVTARFRCKVTSNGCETNSTPSFLIIHDTPADVGSSVFPTLCDSGSGVNTSIQAITSTSDILYYNWQVDEGDGFHNLEDDELYTGSFAATLQFTGATSALNGNQYRCQIGNCASPVYSPTVTITVDNMPVITQQPATSYVCVGTDTEFSVEATGTDLNYQWQERIGSTYVDITNDDTYFASDGVLQISDAPIELNNRNYRCVISSGNGCSINSQTPSLRISNNPTFPTSALPSKTVCEESGVAIFSTYASGFNVYAHTYQWQEAFADTEIFTDISDSEVFSGTNTTVLRVTDPKANKNGNKYRLTVIGCQETIASNEATLTVLTTPIITESPTSQSICSGESVTFSALATGENIRYQWYMDDGDGYYLITGYLTSPDYTLNNTPASYNGNKFKCVASAPSPCHTTLTAESFEATLTVNDLDFTTQPEESTTVCWGEEVSFSVTSSATGITYQWLVNGQELEESDDYTGTQTHTLLISQASSSQNGMYFQCKISGLCEDKTSNTAYLTVNGGDKPTISVYEDTESNEIYLSTDYLVSGFDTFEWSLDETVIHEFANNPSIQADQPGSYTVVRNSNECISEASDPYVVEKNDENNTITSLQNSPEIPFTVFPNPARHLLNVEFKDSQNSSIKLLSLDGRSLKSFQTYGQNAIHINISDLDGGIYLLKFTNAEKEYLRKVIIK